MSAWMLAAAVLTTPAAAQAVPLRAETTVAATPGGTIVATLPAGTAVVRGEARNGFIEIPLEGWVFGGSLAPSSRDGFDVAVSAAAGENLRAAANGAVIARLRTGAGFKKVGAKGGWTQVQRTVWIAAIAVTEPKTDTVSAAAPATASGPEVENLSGRVRLARDAGLYLTPDKGKVGTLGAGTTMEPLVRAGGWVKVRLEGWVREAEIDGNVKDPGVIITAADLRATPTKYEGQTVDWRVQFVAVRTADALRPELPEGQPYALVRGPLPEPGFVYVALTDEQAAQFRKLGPLAELSIHGTIKTGRTRYTGTPVVTLERITEGG